MARLMAAPLVKTKTPGIYKRGSRYVVVTTHRGRQFKSFHATLAEAREAKADRTRAGASKRPQSRAPFDEHARAWVATCQGRTSRGLDDDTRASYAAHLEHHAIPFFRSMPLRDIEPADYRALGAKLQTRGLSAASVTKYLAPVKAMFADAVADGALQVNPTTGVRIVDRRQVAKPDGPERVKDMTRVELAAVLAAIGDQHRLLFEVMAQTGCRISEVLGLDWGDVSFGDAATLRIERQWYRGKIKSPKTKRGYRTIGLPAGLAEKLWRAGADQTGPMFHTRTGRRLSDRNMARVLDGAGERAGVRVSHHCFRHTHGSILLDQGWPLTDVAHRLGDDPAVLASIYAHKMRDRRRDLSFLEELATDVTVGDQLVS